MKISFVVALPRRGVMGKNNALPWHIPEDLKHFKSITSGKPVLMGRKTYESIGRPLPNRRNIVLSRNKEKLIPGVEIVSSIEEALSLLGSVQELCVIGGAEIFKLFEDKVTHLHITWVEKDIEGDIVFDTEFPWKHFKETSKEEHLQAPIPFVYVDYERL
nr:dihydrofolate reductase [uncultured bacterium]